MRWNLKRSKLLLALIPIISIVFYIFTIDHNLYADQSFVAFDIYRRISDTAVADPDTTPDDYSAAENFAIAAGVYLDTDSVQSTTNGTVTAMGFYKQTVINFRAKTDGHMFNESVSLSAIASVAEQRYFKDGALLYRSGKASGSAVKSWSTQIIEFDPAVYRQRYGVVPQEICKYSVTDQSILSERFLSDNGDGTRTYELVLDAEEAQKYSRYEMMTYAGVTAFPEFLTCRIEFTIDNAWHIREICAYDTYKIALMGGIKCDSRMVETFTYPGAMPERAQIFIDYVPTGNTGTVDTDKGPADYLNEAFGDYISGNKPLYLTGEAVIKDETLPFSASFDLVGGDYRFALGDRIFGVYRGTTLYLAMGDGKYAVNTDDLSALFSALPDNAASGNAFADLNFDTLLSTLFENYTLTETDESIHIRMPFALFGIGFDVDMGLRKIADDAVTADTIDATVTVGDTPIDVAIRITDSVSLPAFDATEYVSLRPLLDAVAQTLAKDAYGIDGTISVRTGDKRIPVGISARIVRTENNRTAAECTLTAEGVDVSLVYRDETVYARVGGITVKANVADFDLLAEALAPFLPVSQADTTAVLESVLPSVLPQLRVDSIVSLLTTLQYENNTLSLQVTPAQGTAWSISVTHDDTGLRTLSLHGLETAGVGMDAVLTLSDAENAAVPALPDAIDIKEFTELLPAVQKLLQAQSYRFSLEGSVISGDTQFPLTGEVLLNRSPLAFSVDLTLAEQPLRLIYTDATAYLSAGEFAVKLTAQDAGRFLQAFGPLPDTAEILTELLARLPAADEIDFASLVQNLTLCQTKDGLTFRLALQNAQVALTICQAKDDLRVACSFETAALSAQLTASVCGKDTPWEIVPDDVVYRDGAQLIPLIAPIRNTLTSKTWELTVDGTVTQGGYCEPFVLFTRIRAGENTFAFSEIEVTGTLTLSGQVIGFAYRAGTVYLNIGEIALKATLADWKDKIPQLLTAVAENENTSLSSAVSFSEKLSELLPALDYTSVTSLLAAVTVCDGTVRIPVTTASGATYALTLSVGEEWIEGASIQNLTAYGITLDATATLRCNTKFDDEIYDDEYVDVRYLENLLPAIRALAEAQTITVELRDGSVDLSLLSGALGGTVQLTREPFAVEACLLLREKHTIDFRFVDNTVWLRINEIRLTFTAEDIRALQNEIRALGKSANIGEEDAATLYTVVYELTTSATLLQNAFGGKTLGELVGFVNYFAVGENDALTVGFNVRDLSATVRFGAQRDVLTVQVSNVNYNDLSASFTAVVSAAEPQAVTVPDKASYVRLADLRSYIAPAYNTMVQDYYHISFGGDVTEGEAAGADVDTTTITGTLEIQPTDNFADIHARIVLGGVVGDQVIELYILDGTNPDHSDVTAYVNYNDFHAKIDYLSALGIVNDLCDILQLRIPFLQDLMAGFDIEKQDTTVFETMQIPGLDKLRKSVSSLFTKTESVTDATAGDSGMAGLLALIDDSLIDKVLEGTSVGFENGLLEIRLYNGIFRNGDDSTAVITIGRNETHLTDLTIENLIANGDTVNFDALLSCEKFDSPVRKITKPSWADSAYDFSTLDGLLSDVIRTASAREFHITGSLNLNVLSGVINKDIGIDAVVKILDDGSTVAAVKLSVPRYWLFTEFLTQTDSYLYYANEMLYFVVDVYSGGSISKTETKSATVSQFLADPFEYLFFLIRMNSSLQNTVLNAVSGSKGTPSTDPKEILKNYTFDQSTGKYHFLLGLAALAGDSNLNDLTLDLTTTDGYVTGLYLETSFVSVVKLKLNNTKVVNFRTDANGRLLFCEDGTVQKAALPEIGFGGKTTEVRDRYIQSEEDTLTIDALEDYLAVLFPVEAAETFAKKAELKATLADEKATDALNSVDEVAQRKTELHAAQAAYDEAKAKLDATDENSFGYQRAKAQENLAKNALTRAHNDLQQAVKDRLTYAEDAVEAGRNAYYYARKAATASKTATETDQSVRSYAAAGDCAFAAIHAIESSLRAIDAATQAAQSIEDETESRRILALAQAAREEISLTLTTTAQTASVTASTACTQMIQYAESLTTEAEKYAQSGDYTQAAAKIQSTVEAIDSMQSASQAATAAAEISKNADTLSLARQTAENVKSATESISLRIANTAITVGNALLTDSDRQTEQARLAAESAVTHSSAQVLAQNGAQALDDIDVLQLSTEYAAKAASLFYEVHVADATSSALQSDLHSLQTSVAKAVPSMVETLFSSVYKVAPDYAQLVQDTNDMPTAACGIATLAQMTDVATTAQSYQSDATSVALQEIYLVAEPAAAYVFQTYANSFYTQIKSSAETVATCKHNLDGVLNSGVMGKETRDKAGALADAAATAADLTEQYADLLSGVCTVYNYALPLLEKERAQSMQATVDTLVGTHITKDEKGNITDGGAGLLGASDYLTECSANATQGAARAVTLADNLNKLVSSSVRNAAKANAASATEQAQRIEAALPYAVAAADSLTALQYRLTAYIAACNA